MGYGEWGKGKNQEELWVLSKKVDEDLENTVGILGTEVKLAWAK